MKKYIVLSSNENPEYLFYLPLTAWAWRKFGWDVFFIYTVKRSKIWDLVWDKSLPDVQVQLDNDKYPSGMVAQVSRLYAACSNVSTKDCYLMTGDIDMIPLSDYWNPDHDKISVWGHDLTGYQHMPICYIGMMASRWIEVMGLDSRDYNKMINRDIDQTPNSKSTDPEKLWCLDQDIITDRINSVNFLKQFFIRGVYPNRYPIGRVDRSAWHLNHEQFIDCHMPRGVYKEAQKQIELMDLLYKIWPNESFAWFTQYIVEFKRLMS